MSGLDARDRLTALLLVTRRKTGIRIDEGRFVPTALAASLADAIRDVREDLRALDGQLAACEEQARGER